METGTVLIYNEPKGWGFIVADADGKQLFVHRTGIIGSGLSILTEGQRVRFERRNGPKGEEAADVKRL